MVRAVERARSPAARVRAAPSAARSRPRPRRSRRASTGHGSRERSSRRHRRVGEVAERVDDRLRAPRPRGCAGSGARARRRRSRPSRSRYSRPSASVTRHPSASAQITRRRCGRAGTASVSRRRCSPRSSGSPAAVAASTRTTARRTARRRAAGGPPRRARPPAPRRTPSSIWNSYVVALEPVLARRAAGPRRSATRRASRCRRTSRRRAARSSASTKFARTSSNSRNAIARRLDVDPLAEPHVRLQVGERAHVAERPPQVRLEHDAEVVVPGLAQLAVEPQRRRRSWTSPPCRCGRSCRARPRASTTSRRFARQRSWPSSSPSAVSFTLTFESSRSRSIAVEDVLVGARRSRRPPRRSSISSPSTSTVASFPPAFSRLHDAARRRRARRRRCSAPRAAGRSACGTAGRRRTIARS